MASSTKTPRRFADYAASAESILKLPHPYQTPYLITKAASDPNAYQLIPRESEAGSRPPPSPLHNPAVSFSEPQHLKLSDRPDESNNTPWARARRNPAVAIRWSSTEAPTIGQLWLLAYAVFTLHPDEEAFRLDTKGPGADRLARQLTTVGLATNHPPAPSTDAKPTTASDSSALLIQRATFWQGAGSPFGPRPVWAPLSHHHDSDPSLSLYPLPPTSHTVTDLPGTSLSHHPRRRAKPQPGSVIYSRYIPHLRETFSMVALDCDDAAHQELFHAWQNDPRVSRGWDATGSRAQHAEYLRRARDDPHRLAVLGRFEETFFAYFEVYWAKEDRMGVYYPAGDYDRGRYSLVGDVRFRGPHRVGAWWSSLVHYLFLDDPRTMSVVGEPKYTNGSVLAYDFVHGFGMDKFVDLPDKRAALMHCSRERFFQLCPLGESKKVVAGTGIGLVAKL